MFIAEREGFEPPEPLSSTVFKTAAIDHSAISPAAKVRTIFVFCKSMRRNCVRGGIIGMAGSKKSRNEKGEPKLPFAFEKKVCSCFYCSCKIRMAASRIVVSSSVTTPPSGPFSKWMPAGVPSSKCRPPK